MVIIDPPKDPHGPPPALHQPLSPPPYAPLPPPRGSHLNSPPPPRSPGARAPPSPFSAPASNFLTVKREKADITGTWNINTSLPFPPSVARTASADSDTSSEAGTTDVSSVQPSSVSSAGTSSSVAGSAAHPNLKLFSPRGKIDAAIRVSGAPRAWLEAISREEDVTITFPSNSNGAPRAPIRLFARSTNGDLQVHLPSAFTGTLRVPSEVALPPSLKSRSVVLSPSEPPIERPPIVDESPVKPKLGLGLGRSVTPTPPSPPITVAAGEEERGEPFVLVLPAGPSSPPQVTIDAVSLPAPQSQPEGSQGGAADPTNSAGEAKSEGDAPEPMVQGPMILARPPVDTPAQEASPQTPATPVFTPPAPSSPLSPTASRSLPSPLSPPALVISHQRSASVQEAPPASPSTLVVSPTHYHHHRSASASVPSSHRPPLLTHHNHPASSSSTNLTTHQNLSSSNLTANPNLSSTNLALNRSTSNLSIQPTAVPAPCTHSASESSTVYFIGDLLHSSYDNNAPEKWAGDEFVLDSEFGRVKVCAYGEKAEVGWAEDVTSKVKEAVDWGKWKSVGSGVKGMQMTMPKVSLGSMGKRFKFK
ncbi:hypothetical protein FRC10_002614 [Ceratobasidium sp. 414]|nr:hypothetical protein FRC10_002614 [Ceratobasidium sp. 414]